jgi:hypothetical protein
MLSANRLRPNVNTTPVSKTDSERIQLIVILLMMNDKITFLYSYANNQI